MIQRAGANLALIVTRGVRDILEIQRLRLSDPMNFVANRPAPLIPRWRVFEVVERLLTDGSVDVPLDPASAEAAVRAAVAEGVEGIVVCLINSYRNPEHERAVRAVAARVAPDLYVCCSHEIWPQIREYERTIVTILNAYIRPKLATYLDSLADRLRQIGLRVQPYITKSNGGVMTARSARDIPVETLLSGPASGRDRGHLRGGAVGLPGAAHARHRRHERRHRGRARRPGRLLARRARRRLPGDHADRRRLLDRGRRRLHRLVRPVRAPEGRPPERRRRARSGVLRAGRDRAGPDGRVRGLRAA